MLYLLRAGGHCGIVMPGGFYTDLGANNFGKCCSKGSSPSSLDWRTNDSFLRGSTTHKSSAFSYRERGFDRSVPGRFPNQPTRGGSAGGVGELLHRADLHLTIPTRLVRQLSPDSLSLMEFKSQKDVSIAEKLQKFPPLGDESPKWPAVNLTRGFHMTQKGAKSLVKTAPASGLAPLFEGRMIWQVRTQLR